MCSPAEILELQRTLEPHAASAGIRIFGHPVIAEWLSSGPLSGIMRSIAGQAARAVRAILFDKTEESNWGLGWHQDRTIAVRERVEQPGFDHWTIKSGAPHVEPPYSIIENMLTARIHLDAVSAANAPLLIAPGSHRFGRIMEDQIGAIVEHCGTAICLASPGDVWLYRTAILHASERSRATVRRRVLQVDFSGENLPGRLQWLGVA